MDDMSEPNLQCDSELAEFERQYAERSGVTVEFLHQHGRFARRCDCGDAICQGFEMAHSDPHGD